MKYLRRKNLEKAYRFYTIPFWELDSRIEEISGFNLIFPYHLEGKEIENYTHHAHTWQDLMNDILMDYKFFSIKGYEEYYSQQEQELIERLIKGLKEQDGKKGR